MQDEEVKLTATVEEPNQADTQEEQKDTAAAEDKQAEPAETGQEDTASEKMLQRIKKLSADAQREREAREEAQRRLAELESKHKPAEKELTDEDVQSLLMSAADKIAEERLAKQNAEAAQQQFVKRVADVGAEAEKLDPSFGKNVERLIAMNGPMPAHIAEAVMDDENAAHVAAKIASDHALAERLWGMSPVAAIKEIGRLSASAKGGAKTASVSSAPAPVTPVTTGSSAAKDLSNLSMDEYYRARGFS